MLKRGEFSWTVARQHDVKTVQLSHKLKGDPYPPFSIKIVGY